MKARGKVAVMMDAPLIFVINFGSVVHGWVRMRGCTVSEMCISLPSMKNSLVDSLSGSALHFCSPGYKIYCWVSLEDETHNDPFHMEPAPS
jgi:hypothetical protein